MRILLLFALLSIIKFTSAQDSLGIAAPDSSNFELITVEDQSSHSASRAGVYSAILPGLGQAYNKKAWKIPIVYLAIGGAAYFAIDNGNEKNRYQDAIEIRNDGDPNTIDEFDGITASSDLVRIRNTFRERQDLSYIIGGLFYALNIVDAVVDAHLFDFDVSDDLSLQVAPEFKSNPLNQDTQLGFGITFSFK